MNESYKNRGELIFNAVIAALLVSASALITWTASEVISQGKILAVHTNAVVDLGKRVEKLETGALLAATMPGKLETMAARMDNIIEGQRRIESLLEAHAAATKP